MRACHHPDLIKELVLVEERQIVRCHKIGVIHLLPYQTTEQQALANEHVSPAFSEFLQWLGDPVRLRGWQGYRGGLDVKGKTGTGMRAFIRNFAHAPLA
ncbi:GTPase-activating Rap/Ran-GAP domain-like protein 3 [Actinomortierella wolfii]|nr:GTPase-activating Rap/Ran-GAP domain-like protein 3 [Actinomortierella wolfii]